MILFAIVISGFYGTSLAQTTTDRISILTDDHGYYPCMDCHEDQETITTPRLLSEEHVEPLIWEGEDGIVHRVYYGELLSIKDLIKSDNLDRREPLAGIGRMLHIKDYMADNNLAYEDSVWVMVHGGGNFWCLDCHNADDRDSLVKLNGELLSFNQSHLLCGECHGPILRDWRRGIHGKTIGSWDRTRWDEGGTTRLLCVDCHSPHSPTFTPRMPLKGPVLRLGDIGGHAEHEEQDDEDHTQESE